MHFVGLVADEVFDETTEILEGLMTGLVVAQEEPVVSAVVSAVEGDEEEGRVVPGLMVPALTGLAEDFVVGVFLCFQVSFPEVNGVVGVLEEVEVIVLFLPVGTSLTVQGGF